MSNARTATIRFSWRVSASGMEKLGSKEKGRD
jgi:hypothetical protein